MKLGEKAQAQAQMKVALQQGDTAALGEITYRSSSTKRLGSDVFRFRIGNLPPDLEITV